MTAQKYEHVICMNRRALTRGARRNPPFFFYIALMQFTTFSFLAGTLIGESPTIPVRGSETVAQHVFQAADIVARMLLPVPSTAFLSSMLSGGLLSVFLNSFQSLSFSASLAAEIRQIDPQSTHAVHDIQANLRSAGPGVYPPGSGSSRTVRIIETPRPHDPSAPSIHDLSDELLTKVLRLACVSPSASAVQKRSLATLVLVCRRWARALKEGAEPLGHLDVAPDSLLCYSKVLQQKSLAYAAQLERMGAFLRCWLPRLASVRVPGLAAIHLGNFLSFLKDLPAPAGGQSPAIVQIVTEKDRSTWPELVQELLCTETAARRLSGITVTFPTCTATHRPVNPGLEAFSSLTNLRSLDLIFTGCAADVLMPDCLSRLTDLRSLGVSAAGRALRFDPKFSQGVGKLSSLHLANLELPDLASLPPSIEDLSIMNATWGATDAPVDLSSLPRLRFLELYTDPRRAQNMPLTAFSLNIDTLQLPPSVETVFLGAHFPPGQRPVWTDACALAALPALRALTLELRFDPADRSVVLALPACLARAPALERLDFFAGGYRNGPGQDAQCRVEVPSVLGAALAAPRFKVKQIKAFEVVTVGMGPRDAS